MASTVIKRPKMEILIAKGNIATSSDGTFIGHGYASIILMYGVAIINYSYRITANTSTSTMFQYGLDAEALKAINPDIPNTLIATGGGSWSATKSTGSEDYTHEGLGTLHSTYSTRYWQLARVYSETAGPGPWSANTFSVGDLIIGTCYARY